MTKLYQYISLTLIGLFVITVFINGKILLLTHPRYTWFTFATGIILIMIGAVGGIGQIKKLYKDGKKSLSIWNKQLFLVLMCCVLFFIPIKSLSSQTFQNRDTNVGLNFTEKEKENTESKLATNADTTTFDFMEWVGVKYLNNPSIFEGKKFIGKGFISETETANYFKLSRFVVSCCAVDATPVYFYVNYDYTQEFKANDWVEIEGEFSINEVSGENHPVIKPTTIKKIDEPRDAYLNRN
jgi:putative membrane protein